MDIIIQTTIFQVYDDEWEEIMGSRQLRKFALYQLKEHYNMLTDEEMEDEIEVCISEDKKDRIKEIITDFFNSENKYTEENYITKITVEEALAQIVNDIWQDLTEEEKEKIKEILK